MAKHLFFVLFLTVLMATSKMAAAKKNYADHKLFRLTNLDAATSEHLLAMENLGQLDIFLGPMRNGTADVLVEAQHEHLIHELKGAVMERSATNVQDVVERSYSEVSDGAFDYDHFFQQTQIDEYVDKLVAESEWASYEFLGKSYEGRDIKVVKVCHGGCGNKPAIWIDAAIHAREWIAPPTAVYALEQLLSNPDSELLEKADWFIVPVLNADGYAYSFESDRYWRKSRNPNEGSSCVGTDTNRNFDFKWASIGTSTDPCSQIFHGAHAFSDVEITHVRDLIAQFDFKLYLALHSYGDLVLLPYGYTQDLYEDYDQVYALAIKAANKAEAVHGTSYDVGTAASTLYMNSGTARDWAKGAAEIKYSFTVELRGADFVLPADQIRPTAEETWAMISSMAEDVVDEFGQE